MLGWPTNLADFEIVVLTNFILGYIKETTNIFITVKLAKYV